MALIPPVLNIQLTKAFADAMYEFISVSSQPTNSAIDKSDLAITKASATFASIAGPAIDAYIRSQTIIVPPGQIVATAGTALAQVGATTSTSSPAIIS